MCSSDCAKILSADSANYLTQTSHTHLPSYRQHVKLNATLLESSAMPVAQWTAGAAALG